MKHIDIVFLNGSIKSLKMLPEEKELARINFLELEDYSDPLTSFLNIFLNNADSKTILFVATGYGARAKDYIRTAGIKNVQVRTWKRSGDSIRVLAV